VAGACHAETGCGLRLGVAAAVTVGDHFEVVARTLAVPVDIADLEVGQICSSVDDFQV
jgi:hypothetical protein